MQIHSMLHSRDRDTKMLSTSEETKNLSEPSMSSLRCPRENYSGVCTKKRKNVSLSHECGMHRVSAVNTGLHIHVVKSWLSARFHVSCGISEKLRT